jgi:hypothetical protein
MPLRPDLGGFGESTEPIAASFPGHEIQSLHLDRITDLFLSHRSLTIITVRQTRLTYIVGKTNPFGRSFPHGFYKTPY